MKRGAFVTFEGIEGSGKSTQMALLSLWLRDRGVVVEETREPGGTPLGRTLRALLLDPEARGPVPEAELFLYLADRSQNVRERIEPALDQGKVVLCDRHTDATLAYQGRMRGLGVDALRRLNDVATGGLRPDRTLLFDLPADLGLRRAAERRESLKLGGDRIEEEPPDFHAGVRAAYLELARHEPDRFVVLDSSGPPDDVHHRVIGAVGEWLLGWAG